MLGFVPMTTATTDKEEQRKKHMMWLWPASLAAHVIFILVLFWTGLLNVEMVFDRKVEKEKAEQVSKRQKAREKQTKQKRAKQPLSKEHARKVKKEVERKPVDELKQRVKRMQKTRERMAEIKKQRIREVQKRTLDQYRKKMVEQINKNTDFMKMESVRREHMPQNHDAEHQKLIEMSKKAAEMAQKLQENPADRMTAKQFNEFVKKLNYQANLALNRERHPERFANKAKSASTPETSPQTSPKSASDAAGEQSASKTNTTNPKTSGKPQTKTGAKTSPQNAAKHSPPQTSKGKPASVRKSDSSSESTPSDKPPVLEQIDHPMTVATKKLMKLAESLANPPSDMKKLNDVSSASKHQQNSQLSKENLAKLNKMSSKELYELGKALEKDTEQQYKDARAADLAMRQNTSFDEAAAKLAAQKQNNTTDLAKNLSLAESLKNIGELSKYRTALDEAVQQTRASDMRTAAMLHQARGGSMKMSSGANSAGGGYAVGDNSGPSAQGGGGSSGGGTDPDHIRQAGGQFMKDLDSFRRMGISREMVQAQALPGRKFTQASARQGWLYINTWYIIGPWENGGRIDYSNIHPPEFEIDFDAVYTDGKKGNVYTSRKVFEDIDGTLSWRFTQSDNIRILPPIQSPDSTFYAYTELYFEEDTEMLVAIASDDATRVWINGKLTWEELGLSSWNIGERFERALFRKGTNKILLRLENGPSETLFSFVICPPAALSKYGRR